MEIMIHEDSLISKTLYTNKNNSIKQICIKWFVFVDLK